MNKTIDDFRLPDCYLSEANYNLIVNGSFYQNYDGFSDYQKNAVHTLIYSLFNEGNVLSNLSSHRFHKISNIVKNGIWLIAVADKNARFINSTNGSSAKISGEYINVAKTLAKDLKNIDSSYYGHDVLDFTKKSINNLNRALTGDYNSWLVK